jgi:hypothetical protein
MNITDTDVIDFFARYKITIGCALTYPQLEFIVNRAVLTSYDFASYVMDCFDPDGSVDPDGIAKVFYFNIQNWNDL